MSDAATQRDVRCPECGSTDSLLSVRSFGVREIECQECLATFYPDKVEDVEP